MAAYDDEGGDYEPVVIGVESLLPTPNTSAAANGAAALEKGRSASVSTGAGAGAGAAQAPAASAASHASRSINFIQLACLGYLGVSGGPFGMEDAVGAAGAMYTLIGIGLIPFLWGIPQAMMTAELSTMIDDNGGYVVWVRRGLGNFWGWVAGYNSMLSNICDMPLYLTICVSYFASFAHHQFGFHLSSQDHYTAKAVAAILIMLVNIRGSKEVSIVSMCITVVVVLPFLIEPFFALGQITPRAWLATVDDPDWGLFLSTLLWNFQGWDSLGCIAGEVKTGKFTFPLGVGLAVIMMTITYALPVAVGVCINTNMDAWSDGLFETIADRLSTWLGAWILLSAIVANLGEYNVSMCTNAWSLWAMGQRKMVPSALGDTSPKYHTPVAAIVFYTISTLCLLSFSFDTLVIIDTFFKNVSLALEAIAFARLKIIEPHTHRPFKVPFGIWGAMMIVVPNLAVIGFTIATAGLTAQIMVICGNVGIVALWFIRQKWFRDAEADAMDQKPPEPRDISADSDAGSVAGSVAGGNPNWWLHESDISYLTSASDAEAVQQRAGEHRPLLA